VHRGYEVTRVEAGTGNAVVHVRSGEQETELQARYVVGYDGIHSVVRTSAGITFSGGRYAQSFILADVEMNWPLSREEVQLFFSPVGLVVVAPLPLDRFRNVATVNDPPAQPDLGDVQALLDARGPWRVRGIAQEVIWSSRFLVHHRLADQYRLGRIFLAGDAADVHSPAGGQGMNIGIRDAMTLADVLADVVDGRGSQDYLDAYQERRRLVAAGVVRNTDRLTRAATAHRPMARAPRNTVFQRAGRIPAVQRAAAMTSRSPSDRPESRRRRRLGRGFTVSASADSARAGPCPRILLLVPSRRCRHRPGRVGHIPSRTSACRDRGAHPEPARRARPLTAAKGDAAAERRSSRAGSGPGGLGARRIGQQRQQVPLRDHGQVPVATGQQAQVANPLHSARDQDQYLLDPILPKCSELLAQAPLVQQLDRDGWTVSPQKSRRKSPCFSSTVTSMPPSRRRGNRPEPRQLGLSLSRKRRL
jgi:hypothetical protein